MAITTNGVESSGTFTGGTSVVAAVTFGGTVQSNAMLVLAVNLTSTNTTPVTISSITDASGNVWKKLSSLENRVWTTSALLSGVSPSSNLEVWYTYAASVNTTLSITVNYGGATLDAGAWSISPKMLGVNATRPFDLNPNALLTLYQHSVGTSNPTISGFSTNTSNFYPMVAMGSPGEGGTTGNFSFNGSLRDMQSRGSINGTNASSCTIAGRSGLAAPYSSVSISYGSAENNENAIAFALTADGQTPSISRAMFVG